MALCKKCGKWLTQVEGRRKKEFCNNTCRSNYWYGKNKKTSVKDLNEPTNHFKPQEQPKTNYDTNHHPEPEMPKFVGYDAYKASILKTGMMDELTPILRQLKNDAFITPMQRITLEGIAKQHSKEFYND